MFSSRQASATFFIESDETEKIVARPPEDHAPLPFIISTSLVRTRTSLC